MLGNARSVSWCFRFMGMQNSLKRVEDIPEEGIIFYDIETGPPEPLPEGVASLLKGAVSAPYCKLHMIACQVGINGEPQLVESDENKREFRELLRDPDMLKVSYNGINFDDIVLWREGFYVEPKNRHDMYLGLKTIAPTLPSYSLKFASMYYLQDWHEPERQLWAWLNRHNRSKEMYKAPKQLLAEYCKHDVRQTCNIFRLIWEKLQQPPHWKAYNEVELGMAEPLHEMMLLGGEWLSVEDIETRIEQLLGEKAELSRIAAQEYGIHNLGSGQEVTTYLHDEYGVEFDISEAGNFIGRKETWLHLIEPEKSIGIQHYKKNNDYGRRGTDGSGVGGGATGEIITSFDPEKVDVSKDPKQHIAKLKYDYAKRVKIIGYLRSYLNASRYELHRLHRGDGVNSQGKDSKLCPGNSRGSIQERRNRIKPTISKGYQGNNNTQLVMIPKAYSLSTARTRRLLSSSMFGINFQNQNKDSKVVQLVPPGWLGVWIDSTQIENVVHIWASGDDDRRDSYEADYNWSEYVWLCNRVLGGEERKRAQLEEIDSPVNPAWSVYKQFKTIKLALNFGMGPDKFATVTGLKREEAVDMFEQVHRACPAIKQLQRIVREEIASKGFVQDPFGHIYSGPIKQVYKVVSYLIQGMGTGSFPKAMTIANYETLHSLDTPIRPNIPAVRHPFKKLYSFGVLTGTTHDECAFRISLGLPAAIILRLIRECIDNMEDRFSRKVGGIPLRAKAAFSITNAAEQEEVSHKRKDFEEYILDKYIYGGKKKNGIS
jgi:hypothetical protein